MHDHRSSAFYSHESHPVTIDLLLAPHVFKSFSLVKITKLTSPQLHRSLFHRGEVTQNYDKLHIILVTSVLPLSQINTLCTIMNVRTSSKFLKEEQHKKIKYEDPIRASSSKKRLGSLLSPPPSLLQLSSVGALQRQMSRPPLPLPPSLPRSMR